jgi:hypothetical protein
VGARCSGVVDIASTATSYIADALLFYLTLELEFLVKRHDGSLCGDMSVARSAAARVEVGGCGRQDLGFRCDATRGSRGRCAEVIPCATSARVGVGVLLDRGVRLRDGEARHGNICRSK